MPEHDPDEQSDRIVDALWRLGRIPYNANGSGSLPARPEAIEYAIQVMGDERFPHSLFVFKRAFLLESGVPALECKTTAYSQKFYWYIPTKHWIEWSKPLVLGGEVSGRRHITWEDIETDVQAIADDIDFLKKGIEPERLRGRPGGETIKLLTLEKNEDTLLEAHLHPRYDTV